MQKINFQNLPNQTTAINATNLNQLQTNVDDGKVDKSMTEYAGDLNSLETTGYYTTTSNTTNKPTNDNYYIEVIRQSPGYILQRATMRSAVPRVYTRQLYGSGNWRPWLEIPAVIEGTWTPTINAVQETAPTVSYIFRKGHYKKIGNLVYISFYIRAKITALNGTNNYACISGLPFPTLSGYFLGENPITIGVVYSAVNSATNLNMNIYSDRIRIAQTYGSASTKWIVTAGEYMEIGGSGWYEIA